MRRDLLAAGEAMRARLFGDAAGARVPGEFAPGFRELVLELGYGWIWQRPDLGVPDRMVCTLAALCAVQRLRQLRRYAGAALNIGMDARAMHTSR